MNIVCILENLNIFFVKNVQMWKYRFRVARKWAKYYTVRAQTGKKVWHKGTFTIEGGYTLWHRLPKT